MAEPAKAPPPPPEIGYVNDRRGYWHLDLEPVPEVQWPKLLPVVDAMPRQDAQTASVLRAVTLPERRTRWWISQGSASDEATEQVAADVGLPIKGTSEDDIPQVGRTRDRFSFPKHHELAQLRYVYGHMFFEQAYRWDDKSKKHRLRRLGPRMPRTISRINVSSDGGLESIEQKPIIETGYGGALKVPVGRTPATTVTIPVSQLVAYVHQLEGANWTGTSLLRPAYKHWLIKDALIRVQAMAIDRNGLGMPRYTGAEGETDLTKGRKIAMEWRAGTNAGAGIPFGAKLDLVGVTGAVADAMAAIRYHDEQIARAVLAHVLNLGTQTGSWALGTTFMDFFTMSLQTGADEFADTFSAHVIEDLIDINYGIDEGAPRLVCDEIGSQHDANAMAIKMLLDAGAIFPDPGIDAFMRQAYGLPPNQVGPSAGEPAELPMAA